MPNSKKLNKTPETIHLMRHKKNSHGRFALTTKRLLCFSIEAIIYVEAPNVINFSGNAGGTINGTVINYADTPITLTGNSGLYFNKSGIEESPAGFLPNEMMQFQQNSCSEVAI